MLAIHGFYISPPSPNPGPCTGPEAANVRIAQEIAFTSTVTKHMERQDHCIVGQAERRKVK